MQGSVGRNRLNQISSGGEPSPSEEGNGPITSNFAQTAGRTIEGGGGPLLRPTWSAESDVIAVSRPTWSVGTPLEYSTSTEPAAFGRQASNLHTEKEYQSGDIDERIRQELHPRQLPKTTVKAPKPGILENGQLGMASSRLLRTQKQLSFQDQKQPLGPRVAKRRTTTTQVRSFADAM